jgi:Phosphotransferase enzyme family
MTAALPESQRNALLRRIDWRFLLELEDAPRVLAPGDHDLGRAARSLFPEADAGDAQLAVLARPTRTELADAARRLAPGGHVYAEWPLVRASAARRRLETAGFRDVRCYERWPRAAPQLWLPVDAPRSTAAFLATRGRSLRQRLLRRAWGLAVRLDLPLPVSAVGRTAGGPASDGKTWTLLTGGRSSINKVVGLVLTPDGPEAAVKFARDEADEAPLHREAEMLRTVERRRPELAGVPRVEFVGRRSGRLAVGETFVRGRPLSDGLGPSTLRPLAAAVTDWLVGLAGDAPLAPRAAWFERLVEAPLATLEQQYAGVVAADELAAARAALAALPDLPLVVEHRDCSPWNVLVRTAGGLSVVDWESSEPDGLPGVDLAYFLSYAALFHDGAPELPAALAAYERSLDPATSTGRVVAECESHYCERLGLEPAVLAPLRLLCWAVHCRSEFRHAELDAAKAPTAERLSRGLFLTLFRSELARQQP